MYRFERTNKQRCHLNPLLLAALWLTANCSGLESGLAQSIPAGFQMEVLASDLDVPTAVVPAPDGRIFILEQNGRVLIWKDGRLLPEPAIHIHVEDYWERGLIGMALHPDFPSTSEVFLNYVTDKPFTHHVISRFKMSGDKMDRESETILLEGDDQESFGGFKKAGHQGGVMRFGHDQKLYISIGEQTAGDPSQDMNALQGKILRINPDGSVPEDNPLLDRTKSKYRSIFAFGVRNAFGLAVQPKEDGGRLFFTDVGGNRFEEVNILEPGANYGWPHAEGMSDKADFTNPIYAYPPHLGSSICGGAFYPQNPTYAHPFPSKWHGKFFFVDWAKHWIKALDPEQPEDAVTFGRGFNKPVAIEFSNDGSMLLLNRGTIWIDPKKVTRKSGNLIRLLYDGIRQPRPRSGAELDKVAFDLPPTYERLPQKLSELKLFPWLKNAGHKKTFLLPASWGNVRAYALNCPPWEPGIVSRHWFGIPHDVQMEYTPSGVWKLPVGSVLIRQYHTSNQAQRPIETRLLVMGSSTNYGVSYLWNDEATEAVLLEDPAITEIDDNLFWLSPAMEPVLEAPELNGEFAPMLKTSQVIRPGPQNPIQQWAKEGILKGVPSEDQMNQTQHLVDYNDALASLSQRVRSYLDVHCAIYHQPGGNARGQFDARFSTPLKETVMVRGAALAGDMGIQGGQIVVPGNAQQSLLYRRLKDRGVFRMPPVQYHNQNSPILPVMEAWIRSLKP